MCWAVNRKVVGSSPSSGAISASSDLPGIAITFAAAEPIDFDLDYDPRPAPLRLTSADPFAGPRPSLIHSVGVGSITLPSHQLGRGRALAATGFV